MYRRLYFLFPSREQTASAVNELTRVGVSPSDIHAFLPEGESGRGLPRPSRGLARHADALLERVFWNGDLAIFFVALAAVVVALFFGAWYWAAGGVAVMLGSFLLGNYFASRVPRVHLDEFRDALSHDEILLSVDVERQRVNEIGRMIHRNHPESEPGGVGWSLHAFGL